MFKKKAIHAQVRIRESAIQATWSSWCVRSCKSLHFPGSVTNYFTQAFRKIWVQICEKLAQSFFSTHDSLLHLKIWHSLKILFVDFA
jgi:hypothetical protein